MSAIDGPGGDAALTPEQQALVQENVGLVRVHINHRVHNLRTSHVSREYQDVFQEGCCGLVQAARSFDPCCGIPFAAFALPRIRKAINTALNESASLIRRPRKRKRIESVAVTSTVAAPSGQDAIEGATQDLPAWSCFPRRSAQRIERLALHLAAPPEHDSDGAMTVGERIGQRYSCAVKAAAVRALGRRGARDDRSALVAEIVNERLMIPEPTARTALRRIARATRSSLSRVMQCELKLHAELRRALSADLEFRRLRQVARRCPLGHAMPIDSELHAELRKLAGEDFWRRVALRPASAQDRLIRELCARSTGGLAATVRRLLADLPNDTADELLALADEDGPISARRASVAPRGPADRNEDAVPRGRRSADPRRVRGRDRAPV